ncbi:MAG: hypothetical protein II920_01485 [Clostridia bacterium]|nr:hypothetical protein [Clostridia bacterium]
MDYNNMNYNSESREPINYKMPSKGLYTFLMIVGWLCGALWGALSIAPLVRMRNAIREGDSFTAWDNARKIRTYVIIGAVINVVFIFISIAMNS